MAAPPQQGGSGSDNSMSAVWITAAFIAAIWFIWHAYHAEIVHFFLKIKYYEAIPVSYFTSDLNPLINWVSTITPAQADLVTPDQLLEASEDVGRFWRYPVAVFSLLAAFYIYKFSPKLMFRHTYTMQTLVESEEKDWPQITPVVKLDLIKTPLNEGKWASSLTPMQFVKKYKLYKKLPIESSEPTLAHKTQFYVSLFPDQAYRILTMQMGKVWTGTQDLPIYAQALFAAFAARGAKDTQSSVNLLNQISKSSGSGKLDFSGTQALLNKHINNKLVQKISNGHAYILTIMASMLVLAREDGVLASADFLWLKPLDRPLWYMLNNVGRQTAYVEVAGPFAHWKAEQEFGRPIQVPMVGEAVKALDAALKEILYVPDDTEEAEEAEAAEDILEATTK